MPLESKAAGHSCAGTRSFGLRVQALWVCRCVAHGFDAVPVGVSDERTVVRRMVLGTKPGRSIISSPGSKRSGVEGIYSCSVGGSKAQVRSPGGCDAIGLESDRELHAK